MTLIIEDGTCPEGANSYAGLEAADAYLAPRGLWPETPVAVDIESGTKTPDAEMVKAKEAALIRAFDALNGPPDWKGRKVDWQRIPAWPRLHMPAPGTNPEMRQYIPSDMVPGAVGIAQMELAALIYSGRDVLAPVERGGALVAESESVTKGVDVLQKSTSHSVTYASNAPAEDYLPSVYPLIADFLNSVPGKRGGLSILNVLRG